MIELSAILILGISAQWIAWKIKMPAIFPLILIGLVVGPLASHFLDDKMIDPARIFSGKMLHYFVSLSVGVILFEGGLTLRLKEVRKVASTVRNLLIIGPIVTLIGGAVAAHYILGLDVRVAMLFGSLIIVTGPTVIGPILRNVLPSRNITTVLRWESIIIDPIGALVAVLMYEFILSGGMSTEYTFTALWTFFITIMSGALWGGFCAFLLYYFIKKSWVPQYLINVFSLALVLLCFSGADLLANESGLLGVTVMGMILANLKLPELADILNFKESLTVLLISILFIILAANIDMDQLFLLGWNSAIILGIVILLLRPASVFLSSIRSHLSFRERLYISWIGPRGIVAAAIASIFTINLVENETLSQSVRDDAQLLLPLTFLIILGTVILQGSSAKPVAKALGVIGKDLGGFAILGAHEGGRLIAAYLKRMEVDVVLVDTNRSNLNEARMMGLHVVEGNILSDDLSETISFTEIGNFMALTSNNELNMLACRKFKQDFDRPSAFRLISRNEMKYQALVRPKDILFSNKADFLALINMVRVNTEVLEVAVKNERELKLFTANPHDDFLPLFVRYNDNRLELVLANHTYEYSEGCKVAYIGQLRKQPAAKVNQES